MGRAISEYTFMDRSEWLPGPWDKETIDKRVWKDSETSLDCMIHRGGCGQWCGYVGVPKGHRLYGVEVFSRVGGKILYDLDCHGGVNFTFKKNAIWWFGFDCGHLRDVTPMSKRTHGAEYRDLEYVSNEVAELAKQLSLSKTLN